MKKILLILILMTLTGCGFKPIYSSNEANFKIIKLENDENVLNKKFSKKLKVFSSEEGKNRLIVKFKIEQEKFIKSRDKKNIPTIFELKIKLQLTKIDDQNREEFKEFSHQTTYNNNNDKFELNKYEKELEDIIINRLIIDAVDFLSSKK